jgi:pimeloyl-ACP methyl ester carboxylesterase
MHRRPFYIAPEIIKSLVAGATLFGLTATALAQTPIATLNAGAVHIDRYGSGNPPLILIPGLTDSGSVWNTTVARYSGAHTIYVLTLPGFGGRPAIVAPMLDTVDRDIAGFLLTLKSKPVIIGHSLGGFLAIRLAQEHSDLIRGAIAIDGLPVFPGMEKMTPQARGAAAAALGGRVAKASPADFAAAQAYRIGYLTKPANVQTALSFSAGANVAATGSYMQELMAADIRHGLSKISVPLWEIGPFDATIDPENPYNPMATLASKQAYYQGLLEGDPSAKVVMIDDSRHFIMLDQPERLFAAIDSFLALPYVGGLDLMRP